ncbi:OadG family protein [Porphyromonas endodontalis]
MQVNRLLRRCSILASAIVLSSLSLLAQSESKANELLAEDPSGVVMTITAMLVVFFGLAVLYLCFKGVGKLSQHLSARNRRRENAPKKAVAPSPKNGMSPEVAVAIGMALYEAAGGMHDQESGLITITHTQSHAPSGWSNKAFNQRVSGVPRRASVAGR